MTPYVFMLVYWLALFYYLLYLPNEIDEEKLYQRKKSFVVFAAIGLFVIMGLRHKGVGLDTGQYLNRYHNSYYYKWSDIFSFGEKFVWSDFFDQEIGILIYNKILYFFGFNDQFYLIAYGLIVTFIMAKMILKYCKNPFWGFYFHTTLGLFVMSMTGIRQSMAACILLFGIDFILEKKPIKYILITLLAASFHQSAIFCVVFYFAQYVKITKVKGWMITLFCVACIFLRPFLMPLLEMMLPEKYEVYGLENNRYLINPMVVAIAVMVPVFCLFFWERQKMKTEAEEKCYSLCFTGAFCNAIVYVLALSSMMIGRMTYYFIFYNVVLLGNVISDIEDRNTRYVATIFAILLPGYMFFKSQSLGIAPYYFFWQTYGS